MFTFPIKKSLLFFSIIMLGFACIKAQDRPRVVIGIVVDQMSNDYLNRYWDDFGDDGFKKLIKGGTYFPNTFHNYVPSATGPGHAGIYTGTTPSNHGIVGNRWYDRKESNINYCVGDKNVVGVGSEEGIGKRSPANLKGASIGDMLKLSSSGRSFVYSLSMKDRGAILPAGHSADLAVWWDDKSGKWISSSYYTDKLPKYLLEFNRENPVHNYLYTWNKLEKIKSDADLKAHDKFEEEFTGKEGTDFPYNFQVLSDAGGYGVLRYSPFGNTYTFDLAKVMIQNTELGLDFEPDIFSISFSSTDFIGHRFGPYSEEVRDTYLRFDLDLAEFISFLESEYGGDFVLFLTSDHGVMPNAEFLKSVKIPSHRFDYGDLKLKIQAVLTKKYGSDKIFQALVENQVYLNHEELKRLKINVKSVERFLAEHLQQNPGISTVLTSQDLLKRSYSQFPSVLIQNGFQAERSGNLLFVLESFSGNSAYDKGASHGSPYNYDRQVPLIFYGRGISKGKRHYGNVDISQIAPSITDLLKIGRPPMCTSSSLTDIITTP